MKHILIGNNPEIQKIRELIHLASKTNLNVLILGETGTGKEVVARSLYRASKRRNNNFIKINCAALPSTLLESELFGFEKGAFTGAVSAKAGKFELASDGVMFLDEIGDMPLSLQAKLLRVIQSGEFSRLGGVKEIKVNSWVMSATNHDLTKDMQNGIFREDLYYRLNIVRIEIPPLRERREDIPVLIEYYIGKYRAEFKETRRVALDMDLMELFQAYHWPGNVRELCNVLIKLMLFDSPEKIKSDLVKEMQLDGYSSAVNLPEDDFSDLKKEALSRDDRHSIAALSRLKDEASNYIQKRLILHVLNKVNWNKKKAAEVMQISYKTLFNKMHDFGIS